MFNLLPGSGLGFSGSQALAMGLGAMTEKVIIVAPKVGMGWDSGNYIRVRDNAYRKRKSESELLELLSILFKVIE